MGWMICDGQGACLRETKIAVAVVFDPQRYASDRQDAAPGTFGVDALKDLNFVPFSLRPF